MRDVRRARELGQAALGRPSHPRAHAERTRPRSARRPLPPARRPCRRRPRTAASGRAASPRWRAAGARCRFRRTARPRAASQSTSKVNSLSPMRTRSPGCSGRGVSSSSSFEVRAVGGAEILDDHYVALLVHARVPRGGKRVLQADLGPVAAAEHDVPVEVVDHPGIVPGGALDHQPGGAVRDVGAAQRRRRVQTGRVGRDPRLRRRSCPVGRDTAPRCRADPCGRCARPTAGTDRARRESRTSAPPIRARAWSYGRAGGHAAIM